MGGGVLSIWDRFDGLRWKSKEEWEEERYLSKYDCSYLLTGEHKHASTDKCVYDRLPLPYNLHIDDYIPKYRLSLTIYKDRARIQLLRFSVCTNKGNETRINSYMVHRFMLDKPVTDTIVTIHKNFCLTHNARGVPLDTPPLHYLGTLITKGREYVNETLRGLDINTTPLSSIESVLSGKERDSVYAMYLEIINLVYDDMRHAYKIMLEGDYDNGMSHPGTSCEFQIGNEPGDYRMDTKCCVSKDKFSIIEFTNMIKHLRRTEKYSYVNQLIE